MKAENLYKKVMRDIVEHHRRKGDRCVAFICFLEDTDPDSEFLLRDILVRVVTRDGTALSIIEWWDEEQPPCHIFEANVVPCCKEKEMLWKKRSVGRGIMSGHNNKA